MADSRRYAARSQQHHVGDRDGALPLRDASLDLALGVRPRVALDHSHAFNQHLAFNAVDVQYATGLTLVLTGDHFDVIFAPDLGLYRSNGLILMPLCNFTGHD